MSTVEKNSDREPEQNSNFWVPPQTYWIRISIGDSYAQEVWEALF